MTEFKETKEVLKFGIELHESIVNVTEDGKVTWIEMGTEALPLLNTARIALSNIVEVPKEFDAANDVEKEGLKSWAKEEFDLPDDIVEAKVELILNWVIDTVKTAYLIKSLGNTEKAYHPISELRNISF